MVYCGKPSKGCAPCRLKRTKCDQARPYCGQCQRAHRQCPGYRDEQDVVFRNETSKVVIKAQAVTRQETSKAPSPGTPAEDTLDGICENPAADYFMPLFQMVERTTAPTRGLSVPLEDEATSFFFHNFVSQDPANLQVYSYVLPAVYRQQSSFNALPRIIEAIGLAAIANVKQAPEVMAAAGRKYARALRAITASIQDSSEASTDQTLMTVMLLGLFETFTCANPESMRAWTNHVHGAMAIARLRGTDQLRTKVGRGIFEALVIQIVIDCFQRRLMIPPDIIEWTEIELEDETSETRLVLQLVVIIGRLCALRATYSSTSNDTRVVTLAKLIDADLEDWENSLPPSFSYSIVESVSSKHVFSNTYHVYKSARAAGIRNFHRCARILTHQAIWLSCNSMSNSSIDESQLRESEALLDVLAYDICASAPFILGASDSTRPPLAAAGTSLLWPFYVAATMDEEPTGMRAWIITRLESISRTMGIKHAESVANVLKTQKEITAWDKFETARVDEVVDEW